eukprot:SAG31_NODE_29_length_32663_cov_14.779695_21_plen_59_part_00
MLGAAVLEYRSSKFRSRYYYSATAYFEVLKYTAVCYDGYIHASTARYIFFKKNSKINI